MLKEEALVAFIESICKISDGATVKVCKGEKTLFELDGSVIRNLLDTAVKYNQYDTVKHIEERNERMSFEKPKGD